MGIRLALDNQSAEFFMVLVRCIRLGTEGASAAMAATAVLVLVVAMVKTAIRAIEARPAVRNRLFLLLRTTGLPRLPRIAAITRLGMNCRKKNGSKSGSNRIVESKVYWNCSALFEGMANIRFALTCFASQNEFGIFEYTEMIMMILRDSFIHQSINPLNMTRHISQIPSFHDDAVVVI
jgi:hypothetical protein